MAPIVDLRRAALFCSRPIMGLALVQQRPTGMRTVPTVRPADATIPAAQRPTLARAEVAGEPSNRWRRSLTGIVLVSPSPLQCFASPRSFLDNRFDE